MQLLNTLISLILLLATACICNGQSKDYVYQDSTILFADSVETKLMENSKDLPASPVDEPLVIDTSLFRNQLILNPDSVNAIKNHIDYHYAKNLDSLLKLMQHQASSRLDVNYSKLSALERFFNAAVTKILFNVLAALFVLFILYKLFFTKGIFQRQAAAEKVTTFKEIEPPIDKADYATLIKAAIEKKDYRLAVRCLFLQSLQGLVLNAKVVYTPDKTNLEYLKEMTNKPGKNEFATLAYIYEYIWYGSFQIDEERFSDILNKFNQFNTNFNTR